MQRVLAWTILGVAIAVPARADHADDDLKAVRKAVQAQAPSPAPAAEKARPPAEEEPAPQQARPPLHASGLKWLHVRVVPKAGGKNGRVSVNLPLGLVRAFGDDWPVPAPGCTHHDRCHLTLGDVLRSLDSGQSLVDIEDDEATVKVWVE
jgi:hypothetical protein